MSRNNYLYVDYENKRDIDLGRVVGKEVDVILAIGPQTKTLPLVLVEQILKVPGQVRILKSVKAGHNALDMLIAVDLGKEKVGDPAGFFHILSGDKDFDALVANLRAQGILIERRESLSEVPVLMDPEERLAFLKRRLSGGNGSLPKSRESLVKYIQAQFNQSLSGPELDDTVKELNKAGIWREKAKKAPGSPKRIPNAYPRAGASVAVPPKSPMPLPGVDERVKMIRDELVKSSKNRPSKEAKLRAFIINFFHRDVPETAMKKTLAALNAAKVLEIDPAGKVSYPG